MSEEMFGPEPSESEEWGGSVDPTDLGGESMHGVQDLGDGMFIQVDDAIIKSLLHTPAALAAIQQRAAAITEAANQSHVTNGAVYENVFVDNGGKRPVVFVKPANFKAVVDEQYHSTLLAAAAGIGSDPIVEPGAHGEFTSE